MFAIDLCYCFRRQKGNIVCSNSAERLPNLSKLGKLSQQMLLYLRNLYLLNFRILLKSHEFRFMTTLFKRRGTIYNGDTQYEIKKKKRGQKLKTAKFQLFSSAAGSLFLVYGRER